MLIFSDLEYDVRLGCVKIALVLHLWVNSYQFFYYRILEADCYPC